MGVQTTPLAIRCNSESTCPADAPRCMRGYCVTQEVSDMFSCRLDDAPVDADLVKYEFTVIEYVKRGPPGNISAKACRTNDVSCNDPILPMAIDQESGLVEFELPSGFLGFFEVLSDAIPALSYVTKPIVMDTVDRPLQLSYPETFRRFAMLDNAEIDESKGLALLEAFDCGGNPVGGVHFESSVSDVRPFYIVDHVPNSAATVSSLDPVNMVADGGFMNVKPGFVLFTARYDVGGPVLGSFNAYVRAGTFTFVDMHF
jgi:hypothetical protein